MFTFYEFFCGGGMARAGLGQGWRCLFANDFDQKKGRSYRRNWGGETLVIEDVRKLDARHFAGRADLVWASFPCQDLSLAGGGAGLRGARSGVFWPFWEHMKALRAEDRAPRLIVLENVPATLTSHQGEDFAAICDALASGGYRFGAMVVDAVRFVPQSRPRLFVIATLDGSAPPAALAQAEPSEPWHTPTLRRAVAGLEQTAASRWIWWRLPAPPPARETFADLIEETPAGLSWHSPEATRRLLAMMSPVNLGKVAAAKQAGRRVVGAVYRRTRLDQSGAKTQRAEVRFDDVAGCLRTPAGGSSRQVILVVEGDLVRSRLISGRETARLMGLEDSYELPDNYNEAYHLTGDGVVVPVVRHLAEHLLEPILLAGDGEASAARAA